jgi:hypothetical protein
MDFGKVVSELSAMGYKRAAARAKIAHDVVLAAIRSSGMKGFVTIKGGVVMSGITKAVRRATMDMDVDFVSYSIGNAAIEKFVKRLNNLEGISISIRGAIAELKHQEYRGKRVYLTIADESGTQVVTKVDIGVHTRAEVKQRDFTFDVITAARGVKLLANSKEQIFVEKLKSLVHLGAFSGRYKDVFDMYFLRDKLSRRTLKAYMKMYIYDDPKMREKDAAAVAERVQNILKSAGYARGLRNKKFAWIDVAPNDVVQGLVEFLVGLGKRA